MTSAKLKIALLFFVSLAFLGCTENSEVGNRTTVVNGHTVIDSGAWATSFSRIWQRIYWLDEKNIMFTGQTQTHYVHGDLQYRIWIWNIETGDIYKLNHDVASYCYRDGYFKFHKKIEGNDKPAHIYAAKFVLENDRYRLAETELIGDNSYQVDYQCNLVPRKNQSGYYRNMHLLPEFDLILRPIDDEEKEYIKNKRLGIYENNHLLKVLPIRERQVFGTTIKYSSSHDLFYFKTGVQPDDTQPGRSPWPQENPRPVYYFGRNLELKKTLLPKDWLNSGRTTFFWARPGFVASGYGKVGGEKIEGLYLLKDGHIKLLIKGRVFGGSMFSDGCHLAFKYEPDVVSGVNSNRSEITVKVINVCNNKE